MDKLLPVIPQNSFDPEELNELTVAYQNVCAAVEGANPSPEVREYIAAQIVKFAMAGERKSTELYLKCLDHCHESTTIALMKQAV